MDFDHMQTFFSINFIPYEFYFDMWQTMEKLIYPAWDLWTRWVDRSL